MLKARFIAVLVIRDGAVVQSEQFRHPHVIHRDPIFAMSCFNKWAVDEIVALNVSRNPATAGPFLDIVEHLSQACFVPLAAGGWVTELDYARRLVQRGADKVIVNTQAFRTPEFIERMALALGSQCVVVSLDACRDQGGREVVCIDRGREPTATEAAAWAAEAAARGAGELLVNSIEHDGKRRGYNLELMARVVRAVNIPVIAFGGVHRWQDLVDGIEKARVDAVAAANVLHYTEHSCKKARRYLLEQKVNIRRGGDEPTAAAGPGRAPANHQPVWSGVML